MKTISVSSHQSIREIISWKIVDLLKPLYFHLRRKRQPWSTQQTELRDFPPATLGHDLHLFLQEHQLMLMPKAEFHDVFHVLFEYGTSMKDEACIQFVPIGNGRYSLPLLACTAVSALFYPEYWGDFYRAYKRGRQAMRFHDLDFEKFLKMPTARLRYCLLGKQAPIDE